MFTETELFEKAMQRFRNDDFPATSNATGRDTVRHADEIHVVERSVVAVVQNRSHSLIVQRTPEEDVANVLWYMNQFTNTVMWCALNRL